MTAPFVAAVAAARPALIMEVKRRSGAGADLLADRSPAAVAAAYERAGAACLSVVTGRWFGGSAELLAEVVEATSLPVLVKDFVTSRRHVAAAGAAGASAVLLTAAVLPRAQLAELVEACMADGLTPFVEITAEADCAGLRLAGRCVVAVNNKDIRDRERGPARIGRSLDLLAAVRDRGPACAVSASGIDSPATAARLLDAGYDAVLVGTAVLRAADPGDWARRVAGAVTSRRAPATPPAGGAAPARRRAPAGP